ncbi:uncharacterized protein ACA1_233480 [Acanthamoeba castellanii str. Neff]|uniref:Uncharacterized protein n=1 Tax=Acanthamoeba castellanii (strain ATCC 30010 / Neff) TaxID=1257118 RepID=L8H117_ACACF|nr:uncharacterized protein ACA1_233480 [Acanthamoeba castellanii str. Neff]ELR18950.1 hypothetical protein ACA1_233480 [Acanthamoeba castellanii str. Neff]
MGNNFKIWRSLNAGGVSAEEHKLTVEAMQFSAAITTAKPQGHVNTSPNSAKYTNNNNNHRFNPGGQHQKNRRGSCGTSSGPPLWNKCNGQQEPSSLREGTRPSDCQAPRP